MSVCIWTICHFTIHILTPIKYFLKLLQQKSPTIHHFQETGFSAEPLLKVALLSPCQAGDTLDTAKVVCREGLMEQNPKCETQRRSHGSPPLCFPGNQIKGLVTSFLTKLLIFSSFVCW